MKKILEEENKYFDDVKKVTQNIIDENNERIEQIEQENHSLRLYMLDNIELDNDSGDIDQSAVVLGERMRINSEVQAECIRQNQKLEKVKHSPFFGKIAIQEDTVENYYIGLQNIKQGTNLYVVDWRAPICSLYYYSNLGKAHYTVNAKEIATNLTLKRQFEIENGQIIAYFDADEKVNDKLLLNILSQKTSAYMQNIVKSIQTEQNSVIRQNLQQNLVVQGVAGSGKTSIAMHRIAYLLYDNKNLSSENIIFISPNKLFTKYVSKLLPELGEDNVPSFTMFELFNSMHKINLPIETRTQMLENFLINPVRKKQFSGKFSNEYLVKINNFLTNLLSKENIEKIFAPVIPLTDETIEKIFYVGKTPYLVRNRFETIMQRLCDYYALKKTRSDRLKARLVTSFKRFFDPKVLYESFMQAEQFDNTENYYDNFATKFMFEISINGFNPDTYTKHIVVDEMQDYDMLSYQLLKTLYPKATFTILGDQNQNLLVESNSLTSIVNLFDAKQINLEISYRSTKNIMDYANNILSIKTSQASLRHGENVEIISYQSVEDLAEKINSEINLSIKNKEKTAIIVFDKTFIKTLAPYIKKATLFVDENSQILENEIVLTTPFMAKGLEFDKVIIIKSNSFDSSLPLGKKTLYVSLTRALHKAIIYEMANS